MSKPEQEPESKQNGAAPQQPQPGPPQPAAVPAGAPFPVPPASAGAAVPLTSHPYLQYQQQMAQYQSQLRDVPPPHYSLDVECVATGPGHNDRAVAQIALVDQYERVVLNFYVKPDVEVFSYLSGITGLDESLLANGVSMEAAVQIVRSTLPRNAVLVGQNILKDVQWLGLREKVDFGGMQDLSGLWRVYNEKYKSYSYFSLHHQSKTLLGVVQEPPHNAATDAILSVRLFNLYQQIHAIEDDMQRAHKALLDAPVEPSFAKTNPTYEGVCMGNKKTCRCGSPFFF